MANPPMFGSILSREEMALIVAVILLLVGAKQIPGFMRRLGVGLRRFRNALDEGAHAAGESWGGIHGRPAAQALTLGNQTAELYNPEVFRKEDASKSAASSVRIRKWFIKSVRLLIEVVAVASRQFTARWNATRRAR